MHRKMSRIISLSILDLAHYQVQILFEKNSNLN